MNITEIKLTLRTALGALNSQKCFMVKGHYVPNRLTTDSYAIAGRIESLLYELEGYRYDNNLLYQPDESTDSLLELIDKENRRE